MIIKSFEAEKNVSVLDAYYAVLLYGENIGLKDDIKILIKKNNKNCELISLHQNEILKNQSILSEQVSNSSLFNEKKIIIINDFSEKIKKNILEIVNEANDDVKIFIFADNLEKKSVVRSHFEKEKNLAIIPCYQDNDRTLSIYVNNKLRNYTGLTQNLINLLIKNSGNDRKVLSNEIDKICALFQSKKINPDKVFELINNAYNIEFENLRDSCLEANKIDLNTNLSNVSLLAEKSYLYLGILNNRVQKLLDLVDQLEKNKNVDSAIDNMKPKIFWKDKPIFKRQLRVWNRKKLIKAREIILETEILIKTKLGSISEVLIKKLLVELCYLASTNA